MLLTPLPGRIYLLSNPRVLLIAAPGANNVFPVWGRAFASPKRDYQERNMKNAFHGNFTQINQPSLAMLSTSQRAQKLENTQRIFLLRLTRLVRHVN